MGQNRQIGPVTGASAVGGSLGAAIGQLIVHFFPTLQPVETSVTVIITAALALTAGYLVPPKNPEDGVILEDLDLDHPDDTSPGIHAAEVD